MNFNKLLVDLDGCPDDCAETFAAGIVNEVSEWAAAAGYPDLVRDPTPAARVVEVRKYLSTAVAATRTTEEPPVEPPPTALTPPQVAKQLGVAPETVISWIKSGHLKASNVGKGLQKPRFKITPNDLATFLKQQQPESPPARNALPKKSSTKNYRS